VASESPEFFICSRVFIIRSSCSIPLMWARSLVRLSGSGVWVLKARVLVPEALDWIRTLALGRALVIYYHCFVVVFLLVPLLD
jgi:hypothetical protein